jgi:hypothetical protein
LVSAYGIYMPTDSRSGILLLPILTASKLRERAYCFKNAAAKGLTSWLERQNPLLESIDLKMGGPKLLPDEVEKLQKVVCNKVSLRSLKVDDIRTAPVVINIPLCSLTNLTSLELRSIDVGRVRLESIPLLTQLRHLKLDDTYLGGAKCSAFVCGVAGSLLHLTTLDLRADFIKPLQLLPLTSLRGLKDLRLSHMGVEADESVAVLKQLPITSVKVNINAGEVAEVCSWLQGGGSKINVLKFSGQGQQLSLLEVELLMSHLCCWAPQLRSLSFSFLNELCHSTGLARLTQLSTLMVYDCDFDDAALLQLCALTGLRELKIWYNQIRGAGGSFECLASSLQQLTRLELQESLEAYMAAKLAFGSRSLGSLMGVCLMLRPGSSADAD